MEKLNYELVGKKSTIECLISGEIKASELSNFYLLDIENQEITLLSDASVEEVFDAINNPEVLFVQESKHSSVNEDDDWEETEKYIPKKKSRR